MVANIELPWHNSVMTSMKGNFVRQALAQQKNPSVPEPQHMRKGYDHSVKAQMKDVEKDLQQLSDMHLGKAELPKDKSQMNELDQRICKHLGKLNFFSISKTN